MILDYDHLLEYTDWQRETWHAWFTAHGPAALSVSLGSHGDGRMSIVGEVVRHIFSSEKLYIERVSDRPLSETSVIPTGDVEALFAFGRISRAALREYVS